MSKHSRESFCQRGDDITRTQVFVEYVIDGVEDWHAHVELSVDLLHALRTLVTFRDHLHLSLGTLDGVTLTDHHTKGAVA